MWLKEIIIEHAIGQHTTLAIYSSWDGAMTVRAIDQMAVTGTT